MRTHRWRKGFVRGSSLCGVAAASLAGLFLGASAPAHAQLTINPIWGNGLGTGTIDPNAATIEATINQAIAVYSANFSDPITVSIQFDTMTSGLGQSSTYFGTISYIDYLAALTSHASTSNDATALAHLPNQTNNPVNGNANVDVTTANLRALGFSANPPSGSPDSTIGLNTSLMNLSRSGTQDPSKYDLMAVVSHEIDEALGFGSALNGSTNGAAAPTGAVWSFDLFRYDQNGARSLTTDVNAQAYFSLDGTHDLARFNQTQGGDFSDWYSPGGQTPQVQDAFGTPGSHPNLGVELTGLDVLGYHLVSGTATMAPEPGNLALLAGLGVSCPFLLLGGGRGLRRRRRAEG